LWCSSWGGRTADAGHECQNKRPSFIRREFEAAPGGGGGAVVATGAEFDAAVDNAKIGPMDEAAIATLLTKVAPGDGRGARPSRAPYAFAMNQCLMSTRKPTRPATAMIAQRTPRACNKVDR
jgi:hypothetical protein